MRSHEYVTDGYILLLLGLFPLWMTEGGYTTFQQDKTSLFYLLTLTYGAILLCTSILLLLLRKGSLKQWGGFLSHFGITQWLVMTYLGCCFLSAVFSDYRDVAFVGLGQGEGFWQIASYVLIFLVVSIFGKAKWWYLIPVAVVVSVNSVIAIVQYLGGNPFGFYPEGMNFHDGYIKYSGAFLGTLGNIDLFSGALAMGVTALVAYYITTQRAYQHLWLIPVGLGALGLVLCGVSAGVVALGGALFLSFPWLCTNWESLSRWCVVLGVMSIAISVALELLGNSAIYIGFLGAIGISTGLWMNRSRRSPLVNQIYITRCLIFLCFFLLGCSLFLLYVLPLSQGLPGELHQILHGNISGEFGSSRISIWKDTLKLVPEHLWFGGGPSTLQVRSSLTFTREIPFSGIVVSAYVDLAHNDYLDVLVNTGLLSLVAYLSFLLVTAYHGRQNKVCLLAVFAYGINLFFSFRAISVTPIYWICLALLSSVYGEEMKIA